MLPVERKYWQTLKNDAERLAFERLSLKQKADLVAKATGK